MRCGPVCGRASWNWNFPLKNEPHPKYPISPAIPHVHQIAFGTPSNIMHKSPAISLNSLNSRSFRFQTHGRKGQGAEGCGQGPGWVQILEPNREKHLNDIRKKTCAHASCKTCSAPASPPRRPNRKIPSLLSCSSDRHRPPRRCLGASCHCPRTTLGPVNHTTRMRTQVTPSPPFE
jgi:hypothetical protein